MDIRYSANQKDVKRYTTQELRDEFLIQDLYQPDTVRAVYSHVDRMVTVGIMPVNETVPLDKGIDVWHSFGTQFFLERREIGFFNLGGDGVCAVDGTEYPMGHKDCIYITKGSKDVSFQSCDPANPARFYGLDAGTLRAGAPADLVIFDEREKWTVEEDKFRSKSRNSPFTGMELYGKVYCTICGGNVAYEA